MFDKKMRLHPVSLIMSFLGSLKELLIPIAAVFFGANSFLSSHSLWFLLAILLGIYFIFIYPIVRYLTFYFTIEEDGLRIKSGLIFKRQIYIPYERIQTIHQRQWFFYKPFHVTELTIETAGSSDKPEGELSAVPTGVAKILQEKSREYKDIVKEKIDKTNDWLANTSTEDEVKTMHHLRNSELVMLALTRGGPFAGLLVVLPFLNQITDFFKDSWLTDIFRQLSTIGWLLIVLLIVLVLIVFWVASLVRVFGEFYHFNLKSDDEHLIVEKGLLKRNHLAIPYARIQGVVIVEQPLQKLFGFVSVKVLTAGSSGDVEHSGDIFILPIIRRKAVYNCLAEVLPMYDFVEPKWQKLETVKMLRFLNVTFWSLAVLFIGCYFAKQPFNVVNAVCLLVFILLVAWSQWHATGYSLGNNRQVALRSRFLLTKKSYFLLKNRVQDLEIHQSIWMVRKKTMHLALYVKSGNALDSVSVRYLPENDVERFYEWLKPKN